MSHFFYSNQVCTGFIVGGAYDLASRTPLHSCYFPCFSLCRVSMNLGHINIVEIYKYIYNIVALWPQYKTGISKKNNWILEAGGFIKALSPGTTGVSVWKKA